MFGPIGVGRRRGKTDATEPSDRKAYQQLSDALDNLVQSGRLTPQPRAGAESELLYGLASETREQHERGCLLLSANLHRDPKDAVVRDFLRDNQARVEAIFLQALARAQKQKELSPKDDPAALARFFVVTIQGMRAMARLKSDRKALEQVAKVALAVFNSPTGP
jgi:TetR/AcrR family transcriptional repressor of nem operon